MGLSTKEASGDHGLEWSGQALLQSGSDPKPPQNRRQQPRSPGQNQQSPPLKCPRCGSTNTKFCYYNNYNKSQPRHFCKACKRHWTKGGTLRNVPFGGGRKNKRRKTSNATTAATTSTPPTHTSNSLYQALIRPPSSLLQDAVNSINGSSMCSTFLMPQNQNLQYSFSSLGSFDADPPAISASFPSSNAYNYIGRQENMEDPSIAMHSTAGSFVSEPWQILPTTSSISMETPSYWNWNDIDPFVSADLNTPIWEDTEIKP